MKLAEIWGGIVTIIVLLTGCSSPTTSESEAHALSGLSGELTISVPGDWEGYSLGIAPPTLQPIGKTTIVSPPQSRSPDRWGTTLVNTDNAISLKAELVAVKRDGTKYRLTLSDEDAKRIGDLVHKEGKDQATIRESPPSVQKGWANGIDSRTPLSYMPGNDWPREAIGVFQGGALGCSGTLFSSQLVLTSAHCLYDGHGNFVWPYDFEPGRDVDNYPYGSQGIDTMWYESAFDQLNCGVDPPPSPSCEMYDWAIVHLSSGAPVPHLGWWYDTNDSHLAGWYEYVNGYPGCGMSDSPAGCTYATEYTSSGCFAGRFYNYDSASGVQVNRNYYIGCATSPGESGAPFFSYSACSGCGPLIVGVSITGHCVGTQCQGNPTPNTAVRIDPWLSNTMASLQSMYP